MIGGRSSSMGERVPARPPYNLSTAYNIAKMQSSKIDVALLPVYTFFGMEVCNEIWKKILVWNEIWNGRLLVWNGNGTKIARMEY